MREGCAGITGRVLRSLRLGCWWHGFCMLCRYEVSARFQPAKGVILVLYSDDIPISKAVASFLLY
jgi:hypothetical protein